MKGRVGDVKPAMPSLCRMNPLQRSRRPADLFSRGTQGRFLFLRLRRARSWNMQSTWAWMLKQRGASLSYHDWKACVTDYFQCLQNATRHLLWIAREGVAAPVPKPCLDQVVRCGHRCRLSLPARPTGGRPVLKRARRSPPPRSALHHSRPKVFYFNFETEESSWDHPCAQPSRAVFWSLPGRSFPLVATRMATTGSFWRSIGTCRRPRQPV